MNILFRILLTIYASCLAMISVIAMVFMFWPEKLFGLTELMVLTIQQNRNAAILIFLVEIIFFGLSMMFLFSGIKSDGEKRAMSRHTNIGEIRISLNAIETIALNATRKLSGIKETKAIVKKQGDGVVILVRSIVMSDIMIPDLLEDIQVKVKKTVEDMTGVKVNEITATVENVYAGYKSRVE